jgi:AcrR family transcriptional regulator
MTGEAKPLRADAQRNRARILAAAEVALARDGRSASMRTIAGHADVGLGTIYRHFPTQEALYQAVIIDRTQRLVAEADVLAAAEDPGAAFFAYFTRIVANATQNKTLADVLANAGLDPKAGTADVARDMRKAIETLLTRAVETGAVRPDLRMPELLGVLAAICMAAERDQWDEGLRTRTLAFVFDGLRPHH